MPSTPTAAVMSRRHQSKFRDSVMRFIYLNFVIVPVVLELCNQNQHRATAAATYLPQRNRARNLVRETNDASSSPDVHSEPLNSIKTVNDAETNAMTYLQRYGYMNQQSNLEANNLISEESFSNAVKDFQKFAGIPLTGIVDNKTMNYMKMPRCGNIDKPSNSPAMSVSTSSQVDPVLTSIKIRRKRFALHGTKWRRKVLFYRISQYPTRYLDKKHEIDSQIDKAFGLWSQNAPIDFVVKKEGRVHIDIRFAMGEHGDGDQFDGPGNTLAHAFFPNYGGAAHFDDQEYWTIDSHVGTNILQVAAHEIGHSLGLGHSNVREALMAPFYQRYKPNFKLHHDDIQAIQTLYGEREFSQPPEATTEAPTSPSTSTSTSTSTTTTGPSTTTTQRPGPLGTSDLDDNSIGGSGDGSSGSQKPGAASFPADLCTDPVIDAITKTQDGSTYVFKGDYYWLLTKEGVAKGYPKLIAIDWDNLPGSIDAALTWADGKTFFFKGNKYWRYRNQRRDVGYPKLISAGFTGIPDDIDAAFVWSGNGRTYIFKGTEYWRFDSKEDPPVKRDYPRSIKMWNGVPAHINAAFQWENHTYFFKRNQYYRFNDKEFRVEARGQPPFPRETHEWWFGCIGPTLAQRALPTNQRSSHEGSVNAKVAKSNQDAEWSSLAVQEENIRLMGTHINDQTAKFNPPSTSEDPETENSDASLPPTISRKRNAGPYLFLGSDNQSSSSPAIHPHVAQTLSTLILASAALAISYLFMYRNGVEIR